MRQNASDFVVVCLCADWCGVCRDYAPGFKTLSEHFPAVGFHWLDVEVDDVGDIEVENFPTLLIRRGPIVLFFGTLPPVPAHLRRTLEAFMRQSEDESRAYAGSTVERRAWQADGDLQRVGEASRAAQNG